MKTNIQASKSILAKLLASENITVSHQNVKTAYFDLKTRTMVLPVWKDMDGGLYDLLTGHEVGHALYTPEGGWHNEVANSEKKFKDFLNVIEDARIEKLIKRKFPGLSKSFAQAYADLYENDFFGIKKLKDLNKLNLIDRINLRFKMGAHVVVAFNDAERELVKEVDAAETWDQVVDIARRTFEYVKQNEQDKVQNQNDLMDLLQEQTLEQSKESSDESDGESEENSAEDSDSGEDYDDIHDLDDDSEDFDSEELDESSDGEQADSVDDADEEESDEDSADGSIGGDSEEEDEENPQSITDRNFRRREEELVNVSGKVYMFELPDAVLENIILPNTEVINDLENYMKEQTYKQGAVYARNGITYETVVQKCVRKFNTKNKKVIMHILKEFEMRKRASEYARTQTARTGELNMNVLHKYKFSTDLFKKITVVPKGKNHGFMMFMDMSGSMTDVMRNTIEQMLVLASFCKLAKVPFEVYGFSDDAYHNTKLQDMMMKERFVSNFTVDMTMHRNWFHLKHMIGSSLSPVQYRRAFNTLCVVMNEYVRDYYSRRTQADDNDHGHFHADWTPSGFGLNGTPFIQTLLASREMIKNFQNTHRLDVCNVVYLTDGEGGNDLSYPPGVYQNNDLHKSSVYFVDKKTKKKIRANIYNFQSTITQLVTEVTGCKHIGFYVGHARSIKNELRHKIYGKSFDQQQEARKNFREHKYFVTDALGYDKYFYVALPSTDIVDEKLVITSDMNKNKMAREFSKNIGSKKSNRLLLTKLAEELAVA